MQKNKVETVFDWNDGRTVCFPGVSQSMTRAGIFVCASGAAQK
jgi:hypothetical protein